MNELIPRHKDDFSSFEKLKEYRIEEIRPITIDILSWLQDGNWPVSNAVVDLFYNHIDEIESEVLQILKSTDEIWKYWVISKLLYKSTKPLPNSIFEELNRIIAYPNSSERNEEVDVIAQELIDFYKQKGW